MSLKSFSSRSFTRHASGAVKYLSRRRHHHYGVAGAVMTPPLDDCHNHRERVAAFSSNNTNSCIMTDTPQRRHYSATSRTEKEDDIDAVKKNRSEEDPNILVPPSMDMAKNMATGLSEMDNTTLTTIAALGHHEAGCEVLKRHIMAVDNVSYSQACETFQEISNTNRGVLNIAVVPYLAGISLGLLGAFGSLPMVFDLNTALWFNEGWVTTDIPEPRDLETKLEVGSWTWNWMEPPLGTMSFALLCLQYARGQIQNLGLHPYTSTIRNRRAERLAERYPQYSAEVLKQFSTSDPLVG